ncbi:hypothetical protein CANMA_004507 [Candida margitis]|uniref:uncharacterized protein n=1 Tax=Candida margitis TaxID=1775924 RepID=UPI0022278097|nr:uncharacterized protein CANMA_004507 [Candida margitis]KAI5956670.1 hypothetical protein CANMA_004507 [Candida margitis]
MDDHTMNSEPSNISENVNKDELYKYVLKVILLEYCNETRFRTPIITPTRNLQKTPSRSSMLLDSVLPSYAMKLLNSRLQDVMTKKTALTDEKTRRSLLRLYGDLLDTQKDTDLRNVDFLIPKFAAYANQELRKVGVVDETEIKSEVFRQSSEFIDILINILKSKKDSDQALISRLYERKNEFKGNSGPKNSAKEEFKYPTKSYRVDDMNEKLLQVFRAVFDVNNTKIQTDVFKYKDSVSTKQLHEDVKNVLSKSEENGEYTNELAAQSWSKRQQDIVSQLQARYKVVTDSNIPRAPSIPQNEEFHILPPSFKARGFYLLLSSLLVQHVSQDGFTDTGFSLPPNFVDFLNIVARVWFIDFPTRAIALYSEGNKLDLFSTNLTESGEKGVTRGISLNAIQDLFAILREIAENGGMKWQEKDFWGVKDQELWIENLTITYNELFFSLRHCFTKLFDKDDKPKFGPYLEFLATNIETDFLFYRVEDSGLPKKWEKRLTKALLKISGKRYEEYLENLPRDDTLNVLHLLDICDKLIGDIRSLQKKYKNPFLGFLSVAKTVASITTGMFASDAKMILSHIQSSCKRRNESMPVSDALEVYQSLREVRDIYYQVTPRNPKFQFDLEAFFFPFLNAWAEESEERLRDIVNEALKKDDYQPINIEDSSKRNSRAVLDIFTIIRQYLTILNKQGWQDERQASEIYTKLLRGISNCALFYSEQITTKINTELTATKGDTEELPEAKKNWLNEVKSVVNSIQNFNRAEPAVVYNFEAETCIALNNIAAMIDSLAKLEEWLDPESISKSLSTYEPNSQNNFLSHVFTVRVVKAENIILSKDSTFGRINPYVQLVDLGSKKSIGKTRVLRRTSDPEWDEEFEITIPANTTLELSAVVWSETMGQHQICGKAFYELNPKKFKHNGFPEELTLDLDIQGKVIIEVAVESETLDAMFVMGRAYRALKRSQERAIKSMVEKFSGFVENCFSKANLKAVCAKGQPSTLEFEASIENLCDYLNLNLSTLKTYLRDDLFMEVMLATWNVVIKCADELLLPKLSKAKVDVDPSSWSAVSSKFANVSISTKAMFGFDSPLSVVEIETVLRWLDLLTEFFHNEGNGPPLEDLKTEKYQSLLLIPVYYDQSEGELVEEVDILSPGYVQMLTNRNQSSFEGPITSVKRGGSLNRSKTMYASATAKNRALAAKEKKVAKTDPDANMVLKEDIILRILFARGQKEFVRLRLNQRAKLAYSLATERMARIAAERRLHK